VGVFGAGKLVPAFETAPTRDLAFVSHVLALRTVTSERWSNHVGHVEAFPWGAGLCARQHVALKFVELVHRLNVNGILGRRGTQLSSGEDDLFSWASVAGGQGFGVFPQLQVTHLIPAERVGDAYVLRWLRSHACSHGVLGYLLTGVRPSRLTAVEGVRMLFHAMRDGPFAMRCHVAQVQGRRDAVAFITDNRLEPLTAPYRLERAVPLPPGL
jgi:hypothetical protein